MATSSTAVSSRPGMAAQCSPARPPAAATAEKNAGPQAIPSDPLQIKMAMARPAVGGYPCHRVRGALRVERRDARTPQRHHRQQPAVARGHAQGGNEYPRHPGSQRREHARVEPVRQIPVQRLHGGRREHQHAAQQPRLREVHAETLGQQRVAGCPARRNRGPPGSGRRKTTPVAAMPGRSGCPAPQVWEQAGKPLRGCSVIIAGASEAPFYHRHAAQRCRGQRHVRGHADAGRCARPASGWKSPGPCRACGCPSSPPSGCCSTPRCLRRAGSTPKSASIWTATAWPAAAACRISPRSRASSRTNCASRRGSPTPPWPCRRAARPSTPAARTA